MTLNEILKLPATKFVDVRSEMEFKHGHLKGAINIPLERIQQRHTEIKNLGEVPIVFYCRSGNRSGQAVSFLRQLGIGKIFNGGSLEDLQYRLN